MQVNAKNISKVHPIQLSENQNFKMKCVSIVYKRPTSQSLTPELVPVRSIKRSVDQYLEKLQEKQQHHKLMLVNQNKIFRSQLKTMQTSRLNRYPQQEMPDFINVCRMKYSNENIFKLQNNPQFSSDKKQRKFRSTFVKKKQFKNSYSLKGIKTNNQGLFSSSKPKIAQIRALTSNQNTSKLVALKKLKLAKPNTVLISVDFILNENNFWLQEKIDEVAHKNWKLLQEHSNIVWLTKRQNSSKKLQKYAADYGLRLDGVYKVAPSKKGQTLVVSLSVFEKDFKLQSQVLKMSELKKEIIVINSLKVDQIKDVKYEEFYNSFPVVRSLSCVVHFIQVDMEDKHRFNSPLKILSKQNLPSPNSVSHFFAKFYNDNEANPEQMIQSYMMDIKNIEPEEEQTISKEDMMARYQELKEEFVNYFSNHLKISLNKKLKMDETECSVQFMIGDMLKRNFNIMYGYQRQGMKIKSNLERIQAKAKARKTQEQQFQWTEPNTAGQNVFIRSINPRNTPTPTNLDYDQLINSKLIKDPSDNTQKTITKKSQSSQNKYFYKDPVFLWKK